MGYKLQVTGWVAFSTAFNILNTVVYGTLFPEILHNLDAGFSKEFSIVNVITTLASSVILPFVGSVTDQLHTIKRWMIWASFFAVPATFLYALLAVIPRGNYSLILAETLYVVVMFALRLAVMNNNALLSRFPATKRVMLSLINNIFGFGAALLSLAVLRLVTGALTPTTSVGVFLATHLAGLREMDPVTRLAILVVSYTALAFFATFFSFFSPTDAPATQPQAPARPPEEDPLNSARNDLETTPLVEFPKPPVPKVTFVRACVRSFSDVLLTLKSIRTDRKAKESAVFLFAYLFFSTAGVVYTIFVVTFFTSVYQIHIETQSLLQLFYMSAQVAGVFFGMVFVRIVKGFDLITLTCQNVIFCCTFALLYFSVSMSWGYVSSLAISLVIAFTYSWNASVARGMMAKLIPPGKECLFMGFYSTFTYIGITVVSAINGALSNMPPQTLCVLLGFFLLPSFIFLFWLSRLLRADKVAAQSSLVEDAASPAIGGSRQ
ncbi:putative major facilitator superfamily permease [Paratrimastix pyriformis]|uniref:Major facilitator superfamily permease n=1 Tax=Paratrimastix pyriformis TaxID=342808 RepID=A0ABQ8UKE4_9EUKA|nr:putative major facilitator superfamily permease [Paratrimastix pyriformis]